MPNVSQADCTRCNGTGIYNGTRRDGSAYQGACFNCQGGGAYRRYGRRPASVTVGSGAHAVQVPVIADAAPVAPLVSRNAHVDAFEAAFPREYAWLVSGTGGDFAASLLRGIARYGNLTPRQMACVTRNLPPADAATPVSQPLADIRTAHADTMRAVAESARAALDIRTVPERVTVPAQAMRDSLLAARASGLRKPRLTLGLYEFRLGRVGTERADTIFVYVRPGIRSSAWSFVGSIDAADTFRRSHANMPNDGLTMVRDACANPRNAAAAHGQDTTYCSCCRRLLTDPPSVMAGIGPVCIQRFGWL